MGLDLGAQPKNESALRVRLQVPADVGDDHRIARERHRDVGAEFESRRVLGGQQQWQKRVVTGFGRPASVISLLFQVADRVNHSFESIGDAAVDLEAGAVTHAGDFTVSNPVCDPAGLVTIASAA